MKSITALAIAIIASVMFGSSALAKCVSFDQHLRMVQLSGDYQEAETMLKHRLGFLERQVPRNIKQVIKALNQMTENAVVLNRLDLAEAYATRVYDLLGTVNNASPFDRVGQLHKLAQLHEMRERLGSAESKYSLELDATAAVLHRPSPATLLPTISLARVKESVQKIAEAQALQSEALAQVEAIFGRNHIARSTELIALGRLAVKASQYQLATEYYLEARRTLSSQPVVNASQIRDVDSALLTIERRRSLAAAKIILPD